MKGSPERYIGPPFLSHVHQKVRDVFDLRAVKRVRSITPFIKAVPGFNFNDSKYPKLILKGILDLKQGQEPYSYQFKTLYRANREFRPLPGITSLSVEYKNVTGAIRKAKMNWICHTLKDLEMMSPFFLNPGRTMMLEWGWSDLPAGTVLTDDAAYPIEYSLREYYNKVRDKVINSLGNYDAMLGIITNYEFTMNADGGYTCSTEITSAGDLMRGIEIANQHTVIAPGDAKSPVKNVQPSIIETLRQYVEKTLYAQVGIDLKLPKFISRDDINDIFILKVEEKDTGAKTTEKPKTGSVGTNLTMAAGAAFTGLFTPSQKPEEKPEEGRCTIFLSWGYIEDYIINPYTMIRHGKPGDADSTPLFLVDSRLSKFRWNEWLRSTDLDYCIIPETRAKVEKMAPACYGQDGKIKFCSPRKILVNMKFFKEVVLNAKTLDDIIINTWQKINDCCANFWLLKVKTIDEVDVWPDESMYLQGKIRPTSLTSIVDYNYGSEEINTQNPFQFKVLANSPTVANTKHGRMATSIIRSIALSSKLSNDAAVNVFYSVNTTDRKTLGNQVSLWTSLFDYKSTTGIPSDDFVKGVYINDVPPPGQRPLPPMNVATDAGHGKSNVELTFETMYGFPAKLLVFLPIWFDTFMKPSLEGLGYIDPLYNPAIYKENVSQQANNLTNGREIMRQALQLATSNSIIAANKQAVIPLTCDIELEGISGFRAGDIFTIDNLPDIYKNKGVFQIVNISHEIDKNTWKTKIKASFRIQIVGGTNDKSTSPEPLHELTPEEKQKIGGSIQQNIQIIRRF